MLAALCRHKRMAYVSGVGRRWLVLEECGLWRDAGMQIAASWALRMIEALEA